MEAFQKTRSVFHRVVKLFSRYRMVVCSGGYLLIAMFCMSCSEGQQVTPQLDSQNYEADGDTPSDGDEGTRHVHLEGPDKSKYVPISYKHNYHDGPDRSKYVPSDYKHVYLEGPDKSRYVPRSYKHNYHDGPDRSKYVPEGYKHAYHEGPDKSRYVPGDYKHVFTRGPDKSRYVPRHYVHNDKGYGQDDSDYSKFVPGK